MSAGRAVEGSASVLVCLVCALAAAAAAVACYAAALKDRRPSRAPKPINSPPIAALKFEEETLRRPVLIFVLLLGFPCALTAQTQQSSWSNLNRLKVGQGIEVVEASLKHHSGKFVTVTDELVTLKENGSDVSLKRADVMRVSTSSAPKRGEHALIGLLVGAAAGAGIGAGLGAASGSSTGFIDSRGIGALIGIASGGPIGALIGAAVPAHNTVYRAAPAAASH